jgi:hypothetical protein
MTTSTPVGEEAATKRYSVRIQAKAPSNTSCPFCWFVITVYPNLIRLTREDEAMFRAHLKKAHGLKEPILP